MVLVVYVFSGMAEGGSLGMVYLGGREVGGNGGELGLEVFEKWVAIIGVRGKRVSVWGDGVGV